MSKKITTETSESDSLEFGRSTKNEPSYKIKLYREDIDKAIEEIIALDAKMQAKFRGN